MIEDRGRRVTPRTSRGKARQIAIYTSLSVGLGLVVFGAGSIVRNQASTAAMQLYEASLAPSQCFGGRAQEPGAVCDASHRIADNRYLLQTWATQIATLPGGGLCQNLQGDATLLPCHFGVGKKDARVRIALLGDSHAGMWGTALGVLVDELKLRVDVYLASSCPVTLDPNVFAFYLAPEKHEGCRIWRENALATIVADPDVDIVVVSGSAGEQMQLTGTGDRVIDPGVGYTKAWTKLLDAGKRVLVLDDVPHLPFKLPDCLAMPHPSDDPCTVPRSTLVRPSPLARAAEALSRPGLAFLNFDDVFCDAMFCHSVIGGIPVYMDGDHISAPFARSMAARLKPYLVSLASLTPQHFAR